MSDNGTLIFDIVVYRCCRLKTAGGWPPLVGGLYHQILREKGGERIMKEILEVILAFLKVLREFLALVKDKKDTRHSRQ